MNVCDIDTPCYIINDKEYKNNLKLFRQEFENKWNGKVTLGYSVKTNNFPYMLKTALENGYFAEVVSPDEFSFALRCGCSRDHILYNGPQKRKTFLNLCNEGTYLNLDNLDEVEIVCSAINKTKLPKLGIRVNFDIEKECPNETTCEGIPGRFGINLENGDFEKALWKLNKCGLKLSGLHMHQSSKTRSLKIFETIARKAIEIGEKFNLRDLSYIDIGGGFWGGGFFEGKPSIPEYSQTICGILKKIYNPSITELILEPGAAILATSMDYLTSVLNIRYIRGKRVVTVDGSLLHINPIMKQHPIPFKMINPGEETNEEQIIGGSTCMELDRFWPRNICQMAEKNTKFLFHCSGAYMSTHNSYFINAAPNIYLLQNSNYKLLRKKSIDVLFDGSGEYL